MINETTFYFLDREVQKYIRTLSEVPRLMPYNLRNKGLRFMQVMGPLENMYFDQGEVVFIYDEDSFSEQYKLKHSQYFLDSGAPQELKQIFYNPIVVNGDDVHKQSITADMYLEYYEWLNGKYLDRFHIEPFDLFKIKMINDQKNKSR